MNKPTEEQRYEVDARHTPGAMAVFHSFSDGREQDARDFVAGLIDQGFGWVRLQRASVWSGVEETPEILIEHNIHTCATVRP